jgi:hypothetical protein
MGHALVEAVGLIIWGAVLACAALLLLREYLKIFADNPHAVITLEVWLQVLLKAGGPGYLAMVLLVCSAMFLLGGLSSLIFLAIG